MEDAKVEIVLSAIDQVSSTLEGIKRQLGGFGSTTEQVAEKTSQSWQKQLTGLVALGNAASSADSIWGSYNNVQIRVENATERLNGAQDRLAHAQYELRKVMSDSKSTADDLANAQRNVDSASRGLTLAQNGLKKANDSVVGTYISMGTQVVSLVASLPSLWKVVAGLVPVFVTFGGALWTAASGAWSLLVALSPYILVVGAIIFVVYEFLKVLISWILYFTKGAEAADNFLTSLDNFWSGVWGIIPGLDSAADSQSALNSSLVEGVPALNNATLMEGKYNEKLQETKEKMDNVKDAVDKAEDSITRLKHSMGTSVAAAFAAGAGRDIAQSMVDALTSGKNVVLSDTTGGKLKGNYVTVEQLAADVMKKKAASEKAIDLIPTSPVEKAPMIPFTFKPDYSNVTNMTRVPSYAEQKPINLTINGNVYGVDADGVANALNDKLRESVTT